MRLAARAITHSDEEGGGGRTHPPPRSLRELAERSGHTDHDEGGGASGYMSHGDSALTKVGGRDDVARRDLVF